MKALIVKTSALGDIIHAFPVVHYLRHHCQAEVDWVVEHPFAELLQAHPDINQVFTVQTKMWRRYPWQKKTWQAIKVFRQQIQATTYVVVFDLQGNTKSGLITAISKALIKVGFGSSTIPEWPNLLFTNRQYNPPQGNSIRTDYLFLAQSLYGTIPSDFPGVYLKIIQEEQDKISQLLALPGLQGGIKILVCPGSNWSNKQLSPETLRVFLEQIHQHYAGKFLLAWGSQEEKQTAEQLATFFGQQACVINKLSLPTLQNLMAHLDLVIAMDSLPLHLAGTTPTPTYSVFGASSAVKYKPIGDKHEAFQGACPYGKTFEKRCSILRTCETGNCIKTIAGKDLFEHFSKWWTSFKREAKE